MGFPPPKMSPLIQTTWCRCRSQTLGVTRSVLPFFFTTSCMLGLNRVTYPDALAPELKMSALTGPLPLTLFAFGQVVVLSNRFRFCPGEIGS